MGTDGRCRSGMRRAPISLGTARDIAGSSTPPHGIELDLLEYVPLDDPIKISRLKIRNISGATRRLSVTAYVEWVLGPSRGRFGAVHRDRQSIQRRARCSPATPGTRPSVRAWRSPIWPGGRRIGPPTGASSSGVTARSTMPAALRRARTACPGAWAPASIPCGALQTAVAIEPGRERRDRLLPWRGRRARPTRNP